jgi:hypothetical protein
MKTRIQTTGVLFYQRQTALSSQLILKSQMLYPRYNWVFINNLRLGRWVGCYFKNQRKIQHMCSCGSKFNYKHMLTCSHYKTHRQIAIKNTWDKLQKNNIALQITRTIQKIPQCRNKINQLVNTLVTRRGIAGDACHIQAIKSKSLSDLKEHYKQQLFRIITPNRRTLIIDPIYYLHLIKWRDSNKYLYRLILDPPWLDDYDRLTIKLLFQLVVLLCKTPIYMTYQHLPTPSTIESFIKRLSTTNQLHYFHSPPQCPSNTIYGTVLLTFLGEFIQTMDNMLRPWQIAY